MAVPGVAKRDRARDSGVDDVVNRDGKGVVKGFLLVERVIVGILRNVREARASVWGGIRGGWAGEESHILLALESTVLDIRLDEQAATDSED